MSTPEQEMGAPPAGTPEYDAWAAEDLTTEILVVCWLFLGLCYIFVALRLYVRVRVYMRLLTDDYWLLGGLFCGALSAILATLAVENGNGRHMLVLSHEEQERVIMWTIAAFCPGIMFFGLPKVSIVILLVRLLDPGKYMRWFFWTIIVISQMSFVTLIGLLLGRCNPPSRMWDSSIEGECMDIAVSTDFAIFSAAFSAFIDVVLAVYPTIALFQTKMPLRRKVGLSAVLGIGSIGGAVAIYKTTLIPDGLGSPDFSYHSSPIIIWTAVEGSTHIIAASMPVFAPLMDMILNGGNPFTRSKRTEKAYQHSRVDSHGMNSMGYRQGGTAERGGSPYSDSQVDILNATRQDSKLSSEGGSSPDMRAASRAQATTPLPGPGEILCTNEINITYEKRRPMEPLEAMVRGLDNGTWEDW